MLAYILIRKQNFKIHELYSNAHFLKLPFFYRQNNINFINLFYFLDKIDLTFNKLKIKE